MASKKFEKGSLEWDMFQDFWKMTQRFYTPEGSDGYWEELVRESDAFYKKYESIPLSKEMIFALVKTLEDVGRKDRRGDPK